MLGGVEHITKEGVRGGREEKGGEGEESGVRGGGEERNGGIIGWRSEGEERRVSRGWRASGLPPHSHMQYCMSFKTYLAMFLDILVLCWMSVQEGMCPTSTVGIAATANPV